MRIDILAPEGGRFPRRDEPIRFGIPLERGALLDSKRLSLSDPSGRPRPVVGRALDWWSDGSIRWLLIDLRADHDGGDRQPACELHLNVETPAEITPALRVSEIAGTIAIDTGAAVFRLRAGGPCPFEAVLVRGASALDVSATALTLEDARHGPCMVTISDLVMEEANELRAVVRAEGWASSPRGTNLIRTVTRLHFIAGSPTVRFEVTLCNPQRAVHAGGYWELGDTGSIVIRDATMTFALPPSTISEIHCSPETGAAFEVSERTQVVSRLQRRRALECQHPRQPRRRCAPGVSRLSPSHRLPYQPRASSDTHRDDRSRIAPALGGHATVLAEFSESH